MTNLPPFFRLVTLDSGQSFHSPRGQAPTVAMDSTEIWLRTNRRALLFGAVPPTLLAMLGTYLVLGVNPSPRDWWHWIGALMIVVGLLSVAALLLQLRAPRIAYRTGHVFFYLAAGSPIAVPVRIVEAFFLGQGPLMLPGTDGRADSTVNLVARLTQRETDWAQRNVKPALGRWCEGYITIRGTWCEPLNGELARRLNCRLREVTELTQQ